MTMSGSIGTSPIQDYLSYTKNEAKYAASYAATNGQETSLITYFQKHAASITSPAGLLKDYKALSLVLGAFGIGDLVNSPALVKQLLTQDPTNAGSTAHRIGNAKYLAFAKALQSWSPPPFSTAAGVTAIVKAYQLNGFEASTNATGSTGGTGSNSGTQTTGLQQALYFTRTAGALTSYTQLQSDSTLLAVAVSGLGLPLTAYDNLSFDQQTALLKAKLPIADLQKPSYVQHLAEQYLVQQQLANGPVTNTPLAGSLLNAFSGSDTSANSLLTILGANNTGATSLLGTTGASSPLLSLFA
jgi:hypothetical protein